MLSTWAESICATQITGLKPNPNLAKKTHVKRSEQLLTKKKHSEQSLTKKSIQNKLRQKKKALGTRVFLNTHTAISKYTYVSVWN